MTRKQRGWIDRRGQADAASAVELVLERQPHEQLQQIADEQIEDSPYQARTSFDASDVEELAQGMRAAGFQGVLIVRPHSDAAKRRQGIFQLVYGHRRRVAWRLVCQERGEPCRLPVVVREFSDAQMLMIGAQENLQRRDLDPLEEAQLVAWHERVFFGKSQAEIGAMLGKSSDWVSVRSRIHRLPDALKERLRQRPRAISQMLELGSLYAQRPEDALLLADRVVNENLGLDAVRALVRGYVRPERAAPTIPAPKQDDAPSTRTVASEPQPHAAPSHRERMHNRRGAATLMADARGSDEQVGVDDPAVPGSPLPDPPLASQGHDAPETDNADLVLLEEAAQALAHIAARATSLPAGLRAAHALDQIERALHEIRCALDRTDATKRDFLA